MAWSGVAALGAAAFPRHRRAGLALALLGQVPLVAASLSPRSASLGPNVARLPASAGRRVALTVDDGPDPRVTPAVLDLLAERGVHATFFVIGRRVAEHADLAREMVRRGHRLENHSHRHSPAFAFGGPAAMRRDLAEAQDAIAGVTGRVPEYFRAPAGMRNPLLEPVLARLGLTLVSWTRRGYDTVERRAHRVLSRLVRGLAAGDVLLLHDGHAARGPHGRPVVLDVLPPLLDRIAAADLDAGPLPSGLGHGDQLVNRTPNPPSAGSRPG